MTLLTQLSPPKSPIEPALLRSSHIDGLYVHVPFCFHKCHYCDFYSITRQTPERMDAYVDRILIEAEIWCASRGTGSAISPVTVFFGGGTPSLLPARVMRRLIEGLRKRFDLCRVDEWTVEVNPATADADYFAMLRGLGVDRISFGAQSFDRQELLTLERHHDPDDVPRSIALAKAAGFARLNIDLIYAIPGQSEASWLGSLDAAIRLGLSHYSCYGLTYEPNTPIAVRKRLGRIVATEDEIELRMLRAARERLSAAGYPAYEISNYAAPGQECRHNLMYWAGGNYVGLGPSAASHVEGTRFKNLSHLGEWERAIEEGRLPAAEVETLTPRQRAGEATMLGLRLARGVDLRQLSERFGLDLVVSYSDAIDNLTRLGFVESQDTTLRITEAGLAVADAVAAEFV